MKSCLDCLSKSLLTFSSYFSCTYFAFASLRYFCIFFSLLNFVSKMEIIRLYLFSFDQQCFYEIFRMFTFAVSISCFTRFIKSRRRSSVSMGILKRIFSPSLLGDNPILLLRIAFSTSAIIFFSNGLMVIVRASGVVMEATLFNGDITP